jgi:tetratricopeptide (TPR) repeat protein
MTIQVPFQLRRRSTAEAAEAVLIPSRDPRVLVEYCASLDLDPRGRAFEIAGGFLLELERPSTDPMPGAVRLRSVAKALYVPVDAELLPSLLSDEASGLVRDWGLVLAPGGGALLFDRHAPLDMNEIVKGEPRPRRSWSSFPKPRPIAERLVEILFERPDPPAADLYDDFKRAVGGQSGRAGSAATLAETSDRDDGENPEKRTVDQAGDQATPARQSSPARAGGDKSALESLGNAWRAMFAQVGQAYVTLKDKAQWEWVDHSHLLRKLLQEFRDGDPAKAIRRALPLMPPDEPSVPTRLVRLPWSKAIYNLGDLLRRHGPGRGEVNAVLHAEPSLVDVLAQEYRKAAQRAVEQGDFRRAAYIHGFLLRDHRKAAGVLQRGGLHHDAAMLYLKKLNDLPAAAQAFEAAGEVDRAVELYRQMGRHEAAGDLLRRIGEEAAACGEYAAAAALYAGASPPDHLAAGRVWLQKVRDSERALEQFRRGWARRPAGNAALCALELARFHAEQGALRPIVTLLEEADAFFEVPAQPWNGFFYTEVTRLAGLPSMAASAEDLRDRVLESMARKLRQGLAAGQSAPVLVSELLGKSQVWPAALVSDAEFAAGAALKRTRGRALVSNRESMIAGTQTQGVVTAVCQAAATGELFLGFASGRVVSFRADRDQVVTVVENNEPVVGLAVDVEGKTLVILCQSGRMAVLSCFRRMDDGSFRRRPDVHFSTGTDFWLTPILPWGTQRLVGLGEGRELLVVDAASGMIRQRATIAGETWALPATAILLPEGKSTSSAEKRLTVLTHDGPRWVVCDVHDTPRQSTPLRWQPAVPESSSLRSLAITTQFAPPHLELLGLDDSGAVHSAQFHFEDGSLELVADRVVSIAGGYLAVAYVGGHKIVGVAAGQIDWLDGSNDRLTVVQSVDLCLLSAVACFNSAATREILVVYADGFIGRVAPRRSNVSRG